MLKLNCRNVDSAVIGEENGLNLNSIVLLEQLMTVSKSDLRNKIGKVCQKDLNKIEKGLEISLDLK